MSDILESRGTRSELSRHRVEGAKPPVCAEMRPPSHAVQDFEIMWTGHRWRFNLESRRRRFTPIRGCRQKCPYVRDFFENAVPATPRGLPRMFLMKLRQKKFDEQKCSFLAQWVHLRPPARHFKLMPPPEHGPARLTNWIRAGLAPPVLVVRPRVIMCAERRHGRGKRF